MKKAFLKKNDKAPFAGILLTRSAMVQIITRYEKTITKLRVDLKGLQDRFSLMRDSCQKRKQLWAVYQKKQKILLTKQREEQKRIIAKALKPPFFKTPAFNFTAGCLLCTGACVGAVAILRK